MEKKWLALSVAALMAVQPVAGVLAEKDMVHREITEKSYTPMVDIKMDWLTAISDHVLVTVITTGDAAVNGIDPSGIAYINQDATGGTTLIRSGGGGSAPVLQTFAGAAEAAQAAVDALTATNDTTADDIMTAVTEAITLEGVTAAWSQEEGHGFTKTEATTEAAGSITGEITLTLETEAGEGTEATTETATVTVDLEIAQLQEEKPATLEEVKTAVETALKAYKVDNALDTEEKVKTAVLTHVTETATALLETVTAAWAKTTDETPQDDVKVVLPTTEKDGSVVGNIVLSKPGEVTDGQVGFIDQEGGDTTLEVNPETAIVAVSLPIEKIVQQSEDLLAAKKKAESELARLTLTNSSQADKLLLALSEEINNSDVKLIWQDTDTFQVTPATTEETGKITGTILLSLRGQTQQIKVEKEIAPLGKNQIDTREAVRRAENRLKALKTTVDTDDADINKLFRDLFVGTYIGYRWGTGSQERYEKVVSTTSRMGKITGVMYVYEVIDENETGDVTSELPVEIELSLPKKTTSNSNSSSSSNKNNNNSFIATGNNGTTTAPVDPVEPTPTTPQKKQFSDLDRYGWAQTQIDALVEKGVINGVSDTEFAPANNIKRADFLVMAMRLAGLNDTPADNFADIPADSYYYNAVGIAKQLGITSGAGNNQFLPETNITRQDMFVLAYNLLKNQGVITADADLSKLDSFADAADVADYARTAIAALLENGFINGDDANCINPRNNATRAESAVFLFNVSKSMN